MADDGINLNKHRLSDRILYALKLAIHQKDIEIADALVNLLELAMTRNTGGGEFVERREYSAEVENELRKLGDLRNQSK